MSLSKCLKENYMNNNHTINNRNVTLNINSVSLQDLLPLQNENLNKPNARQICDEIYKALNKK